MRKTTMQEHHCFECGKKLSWRDFMLKNYPYGTKYLISLWNSEYLEFLCCSCFKKHYLEENKEKTPIRHKSILKGF